MMNRMLTYADDMHNPGNFPRVRVTRDMTYLSGWQAKAGAIGRMVDQHGGRCRVLFEKSSSHLVVPDGATQCSLRVSWMLLRDCDC